MQTCQGNVTQFKRLFALKQSAKNVLHEIQVCTTQLCRLWYVTKQLHKLLDIVHIKPELVSFTMYAHVRITSGHSILSTFHINYHKNVGQFMSLWCVKCFPYSGVLAFRCALKP